MGETNQCIINGMRPCSVNKIGNKWKISGTKFESELRDNANGVEPWSYIEDGGKVGFTHAHTQWSNGAVIKSGTNHSIGEIDTTSSPIKLTYTDVISAGINIKIIQDNYRWQKIVEIESLAALGSIPVDADFLEISFDISWDFIFAEGDISENIPFGKDSFLHPVMAFDSSEETEKVDSGTVGNIAGNVITKKIPVEWLKNAVYPVQTDTSITYGSENVFNPGNTLYTSVAKLDSTHFVLVYRDYGNSSRGTAIIGEVSGTTISYGSEYIFNNDSTDFTSVAALDSTHFVVVYKDVGNSDYGTAIIGEVSGTTISYGSENVFHSDRSDVTRVAVLDSTHFVAIFKDWSAGYDGIAVIGVVSGTTITSYGTPNVYRVGGTYGFHDIDVAALDSTHFVIAYRGPGTTYYGIAIAGSVSGTTISYGSASTFNTGNTSTLNVTDLDSTHFIVSYRDYGNSSYGTAIVGVISGTTITSYGSEAVFNSASTEYTCVSALDNNNFVIAYKDTGDSSYGNAITGEVSGATITSYGSANVFNSANTEHVCISTLESDKFVIGYKDKGNSDYGTAIIGTTAGVTFIPQIIIIS